MTTTESTKHCLGCGVSLQTVDEQEPGYIPASAIHRDPLIGKRCFRIKHYNEVAPVALGNDDFLRILNGISKTKSLVIKLVDIFDFNGSWIDGIHRFIGQNPLILVANKVDLLPRSINLNKVENWLRRSAKEMGVHPKEVLLISAEKRTNLDELIEMIEQYRDNQNVYVVGATNVGKSTLINRIIKDYGEENDTDFEITTSRYPGTTLDVIEIPLDEGQALVDTPGIINRHRLIEKVSPKTLKVLVPDQELKPKVYQLNPEQTLFLAGFARIDFTQGETQSFVCYISNRLNIHRTKLEKAEHIYETHHGEMLSPPSGKEAEQLKLTKKYSFRLIEDEPFDLIISGLGWVSFQGKEKASLDVYVPEGVHVGLRRAIV